MYIFNMKIHHAKQIEETIEQRSARLKSPVGVTDFLLAKEQCPEIPDEFLIQLMFGKK